MILGEKNEFSKKKLLFLLVIFLILIPLTKADIVSINGGGDKEVVIIPNEYIEGFFFGEPVKEAIINIPSGGGYIELPPDFCSLAESFNLTSKYGLQIFENNASFIFGYNKSQTIEYLQQLCHKEVVEIKSSSIWLILIILSLLALLILTNINSCKAIVLLAFKRRKTK